MDVVVFDHPPRRVLEQLGHPLGRVELEPPAPLPGGGGMMNNEALVTPRNELAEQARQYYAEVSRRATWSNSIIPQAIDLWENWPVVEAENSRLREQIKELWHDSDTWIGASESELVEQIFDLRERVRLLREALLVARDEIARIPHGERLLGGEQLLLEQTWATVKEALAATEPD